MTAGVSKTEGTAVDTDKTAGSAESRRTAWWVPLVAAVVTTACVVWLLQEDGNVFTAAVLAVLIYGTTYALLSLLDRGVLARRP